MSFRLEKDDEFSNVTKRLLRFFNTGISDLKKVATNKEETDLPKKLISQILSEAKPDENCCVASSDQQSVYFFETDKEGQTKIYKQMTVHKNSQDEDVILIWMKNLMALFDCWILFRCLLIFNLIQQSI